MKRLGWFLTCAVFLLVSSCLGMPPGNNSDYSAGDSVQPAPEENAGDNRVPVKEGERAETADGADYSAGDSSYSVQPEEKHEPDIQPDPEERRKGLSNQHIIRQITQFRDKEWVQLRSGRTPVAVLYDINDDNRFDAVVLEVQSDDDKISIEELSDFSRVYDPEAEPYLFALRLFLQTDEGMVPARQLPLGERIVFEKMEPLFISSRDTVPRGVSLSFQSSSGSAEEWVFFSGDDVSRLTLKESLSVQPEIIDIDDDTFLDVLFFEKGYEEGTGYETYIFWFKWDGFGYSEHAVINILRNLKIFMSTSLEYLEEGDWEEFVLFGLSERRREDYKSVGNSAEAIVARLFLPLDDNEESEEEFLFTDLTIDRLVYPELYENPFRKNSAGDFIFPLRLRVIAEEGDFVYGTYILMQPNPFMSRQFTFSIGNEDVYN